MSYRLTERMKSKARDLLATGMSHPAIAKEVGCSVGTIARMRADMRPVQEIIIGPGPLETRVSRTDRFSEALEASGLVEETTHRLRLAYEALDKAQSACDDVTDPVDRVQSYIALAMANVKVVEIISAIPLPAVEKLLGKGKGGPDSNEALRNLIKMSAIADGKRVGT